jgi:DNA-directed RNA polymerase specialized sigma54-like protein
VNKRYVQIMKKTGIEQEQMQEIIDEVRSLNPKPDLPKPSNSGKAPERTASLSP